MPVPHAPRHFHASIIQAFCSPGNAQVLSYILCCPFGIRCGQISNASFTTAFPFSCAERSRSTHAHPTSVTRLVETKSSTLAPPELHSSSYPLATSNIPSWIRFPRSSLMRSSTTSHVTASILLPASRSGGGEGANNVYSVQSHSALKA